MFSDQTYCHADTRKVWRTAFVCLSRRVSFAANSEQVTVRLVDFGASWGRKLLTAHKLFGVSCAYVGIEAGSKVQDIEPNALCLKAQQKARKQSMTIKGLEQEHTFAEVLESRRTWLKRLKTHHTQTGSRDCSKPTESKGAESHSYFWYHADKPTIAHVYDGGIFPKTTVVDVLKLATFLPLNSVLVFVTSVVANDEFNSHLADKRFILNAVLSGKYFRAKLLKKQLVYESSTSTEPTMVALFFRKLTS
jgi:hypothetical protein